ncbi:MAG: hypothetical protein RIS08_951 [Actinomycetota bacterium]|jgi:proteasome accessory factor C
MPKQELTADEQFNLSLSIVGLILREGPYEVIELARHFQVSEQAIRKAVLAIANSEDLTRFHTHFYVDEEALEDGEVSLSLGMGQLDKPPVLSSQQVAAIAAGLEYLSSVRPFADSGELNQLRRLFGSSAEPRPARNSLLDSILNTCQQAIRDGKQIDVDYLNQLGERAERLVDPLRLDLMQGRYYLRGWCHKNNEVRAFRLDRVARASITTNPISEQAKSASVPDEDFGESQNEVIVTLEIDRTATELFWNFPLAGTPIEQSGTLVGKIRVGSYSALARHIAKFGSRAKVLEPVEAKLAVRQFALRALGNVEGEG